MDPGSSTIILIDSDASVRRALARLLATAGFESECFASGEEFLEGWKDGGASCVVSDIRLPGINGIELMRQTAEAHPGLPFILLTAKEDEETRRKARLAGATAFFRKPVDSEALLDAIRWAIHSPLPVASPPA